MTTRTYDTEWHAEEIELYAVNTYELYANRQHYERKSVELLRHNGDTPETRNRMYRFFRAWINHAAQLYKVEVGRKRFSAEALNIAAQSVVDSTIAEYNIGNYDYMSYGLTIPRQQPRGMDTYHCCACDAQLPQPLTQEAVDTGMCATCAHKEQAA